MLANGKVAMRSWWAAGGSGRRGWLGALTAVLIGTLAQPTAAAAPPRVDWGRALVDATMRDHPDPAKLPWLYTWALFLHGQHLVWRRTREPRYLEYLKAWGDAHVLPDGTAVDRDALGRPVPVALRSLDFLNPGRLAVTLFALTGENRYRLAARKVRAQLAPGAYPRTTDGGFWHGRGVPGQLWADGTYMSTAFLLAYAEVFAGEEAAARDEAALQLEVYGRHLQDPATGLLRHAFDEGRRAAWADPVTGLSPEVWCRAVGWYGVALVDTLAVLPADHPRRAALLSSLRRLVAGLQRHQDRTSWRWFEVMDKGALPGNWVETSCSAMHAYVVAQAVAHGWRGPRYQALASNAFQGVLDTVSLDAQGRARLEGTVIGTSVGDLAYYLARPRQTNNVHGIGAFLIVHEQLAPVPAGASLRWFEAEAGSLTAPLVVVTDAAASGNAVVLAPTGNNSLAGPPANGRARYGFTLAAPGRYKLWARVGAVTERSNSYWVRVDGGAWLPWNLPVHGSPYWSFLRATVGPTPPTLLDLTAGRHVVELAYRENDTRLDKLLLTDALHLVPHGPGG
jgi:unsaturated rhamnogalacturonyl hydrolase